MATAATTAEPYRVRVNVPRAVACAKGVVNPVKNHEQFLELVFALSGPGFQKAYERFLDSADGRAQLRERDVGDQWPMHGQLHLGHHVLRHDARDRNSGRPGGHDAGVWRLQRGLRRRSRGWDRLRAR